MRDLNIGAVKQGRWRTFCARCCEGLAALPASIGELVSLRRLYVSQASAEGGTIEKLPDSICQLTELRHLEA